MFKYFCNKIKRFKESVLNLYCTILLEYLNESRNQFVFVNLFERLIKKN